MDQLDASLEVLRRAVSGHLARRSQKVRALLIDTAHNNFGQADEKLGEPRPEPAQVSRGWFARLFGG